jgi:hypothetical protein
MIPKSLSATALTVWESCPARYVAESFKKAPEVSGVYADLGSACHGALEMYVREVYVERTARPDVDRLIEYFDYDFGDRFGVVGSGDLYNDGVAMMRNWFTRSNILDDGRTIVSLETKDHFDINTSAGVIPFNYIFDRLDLHEDGSVEVVDYKSIRFRLSPEGLKDKIQARAYAVAAQLLYPDAPRVWVTFDLLRYDPVGIVFSREENLATWRFIKRRANEIIATSEVDAPETVNAECRFCIRKQVCESILAHEDVGGVLALADPLAAAKARARADQRIKALTASIAELDAFIMQSAEHDDVDTYEDDEVRVWIDSRPARWPCSGPSPRGTRA